METVKLSRIAMELSPDLYPFLKEKELESLIVLRNGFGALEMQDAVEIIKYSISEHQKGALLH